jgi:hypothetical protein
MPDDNVMRLHRVLINAQIAAPLVTEFVQKTAIDGGGGIINSHKRDVI